MASALFVFLTLSSLIVGFAILTNLYRDQRRYDIQLKPNCLLTRHPIVFVTGPRSLFYFRKYWNAYPEILAEHGYEVFTLHLPWSGTARQLRMKEFLNPSKGTLKKYHFICDEGTHQEFLSFFEQSPLPASLTVFKYNSNQHTQRCSKIQSYTLSLSYKLHRLRYSSLHLPQAEDLGLFAPAAASSLLEQAQKLGEQDFIS